MIKHYKSKHQLLFSPVTLGAKISFKFWSHVSLQWENTTAPLLCQCRCHALAEAPYVATHKSATKSSNNEVLPVRTGFAVCLCPGCKCWLITKPHIFCRSAIHCCSSDWQEKKEEYRYVRLTQILQGGLYLEIKLGLTDEENKYMENTASSYG